jgi:hypothetical protein
MSQDFHLPLFGLFPPEELQEVLIMPINSDLQKTLLNVGNDTMSS